MGTKREKSYAQGSPSSAAAPVGAAWMRPAAAWCRTGATRHWVPNYTPNPILDILLPMRRRARANRV